MHSPFPIPPLSECITAESGGDAEDYLVVYEMTGTPDPFNLASSYLHAASVIIRSFQERPLKAGDDQIAVPLLHLYVHAIELCVKALIEKLEAHRLAGTCRTISAPPQDYGKQLKSHHLGRLVAIAEEMLPHGNSLHAFPGFADVSSFVQDLFAFGITSEATRYTTTSQRKRHRLHGSQATLRPLLLHKALTAICSRVLQYVGDDELHLCRSGEFSPVRLEELKLAREVMTLYRKRLPIPPPAANASLPTRQGSMEVGFQAALEGFDRDQRCALVMGLYFTDAPVTIEHLDYFRAWRDEQLQGKLRSRLHHFTEAFEGLGRHIAMVERIQCPVTSGSASTAIDRSDGP